MSGMPTWRHAWFFFKMDGCREAIEATEEERTLSRLTRTHRRLVNERRKHLARLRAVFLELKEVLIAAHLGRLEQERTDAA